MDAALGLSKAGPATSAGAIGTSCARTWHAADARVAAVEQRIVGHILREDIGPDLALAPEGQRVELEQVVAWAPLHQLGRGARGRLVAADAADLGVVGAQRL